MCDNPCRRFQCLCGWPSDTAYTRIDNSITVDVNYLMYMHRRAEKILTEGHGVTGGTSLCRKYPETISLYLYFVVKFPLFFNFNEGPAPPPGRPAYLLIVYVFFCTMYCTVHYSTVIHSLRTIRVQYLFERDKGADLQKIWRLSDFK